MTIAERVFLLSPARSSGARAKMLLRKEASFPLARALRSTEGAPIGDVFAFLSGLYFRGKLTYAARFAPETSWVITPSLGLCPPGERVTADTLLQFAEIDIKTGDPRFRDPLARDAAGLDRASGRTIEVVLLGSIASSKYVELLGELFGERLLFPKDFVGRGDMSRGGLLLRAARDGRELAYAPVLGTERKGKRPPRLIPVRGILKDAGK